MAAKKRARKPAVKPAKGPRTWGELTVLADGGTGVFVVQDAINQVFRIDPIRGTMRRIELEPEPAPG